MKQKNEWNLIVTGLYPNEIGRKKSGTFAPLNKSFKDVIQIADIISGAVFVVIDGFSAAVAPQFPHRAKDNTEI